MSRAPTYRDPRAVPRSALSKVRSLGEGEEDDTPPTGAKVTVHYTGVLQATGQIFDSSRHATPNTQTRLPPASWAFGLG